MSNKPLLRVVFFSHDLMGLIRCISGCWPNGSHLGPQKRLILTPKETQRKSSKIHEIPCIWASLFFSGPTLWWMQIGNINVSEEKGYGGPDRHATTTRRTTCSNELCFLNALPMWRIDMKKSDVKRWSMWENHVYSLVTCSSCYDMLRIFGKKWLYFNIHSRHLWLFVWKCWEVQELSGMSVSIVRNGPWI